MKNIHLTDHEIQVFLFQESGADHDISAHLQHCGECRMKVDQYKQIFELAAKEEKAAFAFDLSELVMQQLPSRKTEVSLWKSLIYLVLLIALPVAGVLVYLFYTRFSLLLTGVSPFFIYLTATGMISMLLFQTVDTYIKYKKKIDALGIY
jgi:predicted anti-sigma-YlaC factor YlaD